MGARRAKAMDEIYSADEFARSCGMRGYCRHEDAIAWMQAQGMEAATEADFERCYHDINIEPIKSRRIGLWSDGRNPCDPAHVKNSCGKTYNAQMMQAQRAIDTTEKWIKRIKEAESDA